MRILFFVAVTIGILGCSDPATTYTVQKQVISPKQLTYSHGVSVDTLSVTHTCTCPFSWTVYVLTNTSVLRDTTGYGDSQVPIRIDRSQLAVDTLHAMMQVKSAFGTDTVQVTVIR